MQQPSMRRVSLATLVGATVAVGEASSPVNKVIELLNGMIAKGKENMHQEQVQFASFKQFCDDTTVEKKRTVEAAAEQIEILEANIKKLVADAAQLGKEISGHDADIAAWTGDEKAASKVREIEHADYQDLHTDYSESIDALQRAVTVLKNQAYDRPQASSLSQVAALKARSLIPAEAKKAIDLFLQQQASQDPLDGMSVSAPEAHGYESQSHGVIDILVKLQDKFLEERTALEKEEMNSKHAYDMLMQDLKAQIQEANVERTEKAQTKSKKLQYEADDKGSLQDVSSTKKADEHYLADLTASCETKASDFEQRQQLRTSELGAIQKALEILNSDAVSGNAAKHLPAALMQAKAALSQLRSQSHSPTQERVAAYLASQATQLNSRVLSTIATHVAQDPFDKVKKLIKDLIVRLMEEANEEASHKGWCDTELSVNEQTRKEKTASVETLHAEIDTLQASISKLSEDLTALHEGVVALNTGMADATKIRQEEKAENTATITDAKDAQNAVAQAVQVLRDYYAVAMESTALVQQKGNQKSQAKHKTQKSQQQPAIFDAPYQGMQAENDGVIGMLEVVMSDFGRLEAATDAAESEAQMYYDKFMTDSKVDLAHKTTDIQHHEAKKQDQEQALTMKEGDLQGTQKELDASLAYYDKLKPSCVNSGNDYGDRVARRKEEIESLQEALRILNGESI